MNTLIFLIPIALFLGALGLGAFLWSLKSGQYDDMDGPAHSILFDDEDPQHQAGVDEAAGKHHDQDGPRG